MENRRRNSLRCFSGIFRRLKRDTSDSAILRSDGQGTERAAAIGDFNFKPNSREHRSISREFRDRIAHGHETLRAIHTRPDWM